MEVLDVKWKHNGSMLKENKHFFLLKTNSFPLQKTYFLGAESKGKQTFSLLKNK